MPNTTQNTESSLKYPIIIGKKADGSPLPLYRVFPRKVTGLWNVTKPVEYPDTPSITYMGNKEEFTPQTTATSDPILKINGWRLHDVCVIYYFKDIPMPRDAKQFEMVKIVKELNKLRTSPLAIKQLQRDQRYRYFTELLHK